MRTPRDFHCTTCGAKPGSPCKRPSGHTIPFGAFHAGRQAQADFLNEGQTATKWTPQHDHKELHELRLF